MTKRTCSKFGQWVSVSFVALGLGSVAFGLVGFKKHQHAADEVAQVAMRQGRRPTAQSAETFRAEQQMARFNLLVWTGVQFSFFGAVVGVASAMMARGRRSGTAGGAGGAGQMVSQPE